MSSIKEQRTEQIIRELAADFLQRESNRTSLVTVTGVTLADRMSKATILLSVLPEDRQDEAVKFAQRKRLEFKEYVKKHARIGKIPMFDFVVDYGEKNRQRIDELSTK